MQYQHQCPIIQRDLNLVLPTVARGVTFAIVCHSGTVFFALSVFGQNQLKICFCILSCFGRAHIGDNLLLFMPLMYSTYKIAVFYCFSTMVRVYIPGFLSKFTVFISTFLVLPLSAQC